AVADSQRFLNIANDRYVGGLVTYLDVVTAEQTLLTNQRLATQIQGQRLVTSVFLVKALGGGWDRKEIDALFVRPTAKSIVQQCHTDRISDRGRSTFRQRILQHLIGI